MNGNQPPPIPTAPAKKSGMPTWAIVLVVVGVVGFVGIAVIGLLAAIAIPNFVKARNTAQMNYSINNLRQIDGAKQQWALEKGKEQTDTPTQSDITPYFKDSRMPVCAAGGVYTINPVGEPPTCSIPGHKLPVH
jgi:hypothetical protein